VIEHAKIANDSTHPHIDFLRCRPVLLNTALKTRFGYTPQKTSVQASEAFVAARAQQNRPVKR
jgi:UDP-glucose 4-epimerase